MISNASVKHAVLSNRNLKLTFLQENARKLGKNLKLEYKIGQILYKLIVKSVKMKSLRNSMKKRYTLFFEVY